MNAAGARYRICVWAVFLGGLGYLAYLNSGAFDVAAAHPSLATVVLWVALATVTAMSPIPLPRGTATASLIPALDLAAILLFGPATACWIGLLSRLVTNTAERWHPRLPCLLRLGQGILAIGAGGIFYLALGGETGGTLDLAPSQILPVLGACAAYVLVKTAIGAATASLGAPRLAGRAGLLYVMENVSPELMALPVGYVLALTQVRVGAVGVALFLLPLLLARYFYRHWVETKRAHLDMVRTLMTAVDAEDPLTRGHSYRISKLCVRVGQRLGMSERDLEELEFAALLHDIGRTAIRRDILVKPGRLTEAEQSLLRTHPKVGHDLLAGIRLFESAAEIVYSHHEQPDGKGYPRGLKGEDIPVGSRIIMAVGAFDAMTSDRPYRRGLSPEAAIEELRSKTGTQFFSEVVDALVELHADGSLFESLDEEHLETYAQGAGNSRAVEEWLKRRSSVPEKRGTADADPGRGLPVIEFPVAELPARSDGKVIPMHAKGGWKLTVAGKTDLGCRRTNNEDSFGIFESGDAARGCLLVLADGMGGAAAGEVASRMAVEEVRDAYQAGKRGLSARDALRKGFEAAHRTIRSRSLSERQLEGMGTTCTAVGIAGRELVLAHVGDSRCYLVGAESIQQLSEDHTLAAELESMGSSRGASEATSHVLTRSLGSGEEITIDVSKPFRLDAGSSVVLCSDGLSNMVDADEILDVLRQEEPEAACHTLIDLARARGGPDNITVVIGKIERE